MVENQNNFLRVQGIMKIKKILFYGAMMLMSLTALSSCSDENDELQLPGGSEEVLVLAAANSFYDLKLPDGQAWKVESFPEWASPLNAGGNAGEKLTLFVETNDNDEDRTGEVLVKAGNADLCYQLKQHGRMSDDSNGEIISDPNLKMTYGTGFTVNVFGDSKTDKYQLMGRSPLNFAKLFTELKTIGEEDAMFKEQTYFSETESVTGSTQTTLANKWSVDAGLDVGITGFKLNVSGGFSKNTSSDTKYSYAITEIKHVIGSTYLRAGAINYLVDNNKDIFQYSFKQLVDKLTKNPNDKTAMKKMLDTYGTHLIVQGTLGGELKLSMQMTVTDKLSGQDIHAALDLGSKVINAKGDFKMNEKEKELSENTAISLTTYGGSNVFSLAPGSDFVTFQTYVKNKVNLDKWAATIKDWKQPKVIDIQTMPIYDLMPTPELRRTLMEYMIGEYQKEKYENQNVEYTGTNLYKITGIANTDNRNMSANLYIPEIDLKVEAKNGMVDFLSTTEPSIVIYSGTENDISYDKGFFIGSDTRQPCKFWKDQDGKYQKEVFDRLPAKALDVVYADANGELTIAPKGDPMVYKEIQAKWKFDLTGKSGEYHITRDVTLTGKNAQCKIIVDEPATVTLDGLTNIGSIICKDSTRIVSAPNSMNFLESWSTVIELNSGYTVIDGEGTIQIEMAGNAAAGIGAVGNVDGLCIKNGILKINNTSSLHSVVIGVNEPQSTLGRINIEGGDININTSGLIGIGVTNGHLENLKISGGKLNISVKRDMLIAIPIGCSLLAQLDEVLICGNAHLYAKTIFRYIFHSYYENSKLSIRKDNVDITLVNGKSKPYPEGYIGGFKIDIASGTNIKYQ